MTSNNGPMRWAGNFAGLAAVLSLGGLLTGDVVSALVAGGLYAAIAYGLFRGLRWVGYVSFVVLFLGVSVALAGIWSPDQSTGLLSGATALALAIAVVCLFAALWRPARPLDM